MTEWLSVLTLVLVIVLIAVVVALLRRGPAGSGLLQQQLIELRSRFDSLVAAQQELPRSIAEGKAAQAESLAEVRERLAALAESTRRLEALGESVVEVQQLLKVPRLRGTLGEVWLEELLRQVFPDGLYEMQYTFRSGERVDAVLRVGDRLVCIDSKFPLEACQRMLAAAEGDEQARERRAFHRTLKDRVDEIADRYIRPEEGTMDFALMYVPAERVYYEAVVAGGEAEQSEGVVAYALDRRVIPVSPNTFYAYLQAVLHGLKGLAVERRAKEIRDSLTALRQQLERFERAHELVGRHLDNAQKQYEESGRHLRRLTERVDELTDADRPGAGAIDS